MDILEIWRGMSENCLMLTGRQRRKQRVEGSISDDVGGGSRGPEADVDRRKLRKCVLESFAQGGADLETATDGERVLRWLRGRGMWYRALPC